MAQRKGQTGNPFGRPKGSANKTTSEIRNAFQMLVSNNIDTLQDDLDELEAEKRISFILKMAEFILPKIQNVTYEEQAEIEYQKLFSLLQKAPEEAIDQITARMINLNLDDNEED